MDGSLVPRRLPVVFHALDLERKTKDVPCVICPVRRDLMALGGCAYCSEFTRVDFDAEARPVLSCRPRSPRVTSAASSSGVRVIDVMRMPLIVAAAESALDSARPYLELGCTSDVIVVLDKFTRPVGLVSVGQLRLALTAMSEEETQEVTFASIMDRSISCVTPDTSLQDAAAVLARSEAPRLCVVSIEGTFLGLVTRAELDFGPH